MCEGGDERHPIFCIVVEEYEATGKINKYMYSESSLKTVWRRKKDQAQIQRGQTNTPKRKKLRKGASHFIKKNKHCNTTCNKPCNSGKQHHELKKGRITFHQKDERGNRRQGGGKTPDILK